MAMRYTEMGGVSPGAADHLWTHLSLVWKGIQTFRYHMAAHQLFDFGWSKREPLIKLNHKKEQGILTLEPPNSETNRNNNKKTRVKPGLKYFTLIVDPLKQFVIYEKCVWMCWNKEAHEWDLTFLMNFKLNNIVFYMMNKAQLSLE